MPLESVSILDLVEPWSLYIFGQPGCGKTTLCAYAPKPLFLMVDRNGHRALRRLPPEFHSLQMVRTKSYNMFVEAVKQLERNVDCFGSFETLVVDTWSRLQALSNKEQAQKLGAGRKGLSENEFRETNTRMEDLMTRLQDLGKNTVFLAHEKEEKDNEGTTIVIRPANSEGTMGNVIAQTDGVFYMTSIGRSDGNAKRTLRTMATGTVKAKSRFAEKLPNTIDDPNEKFWHMLEVN